MNAQLGLMLGIASLIMMGLGNAISKTPSKYFSANKMVFFRNFFTSLVILVFMLFNLSQVNFSLKYTLITFLIAILGYFPLFFFYKGMAIGKVGIISPVSNSYTLITTALSFAVFGERLKIGQMASVLVIIFGIMLISINFKDFKNSNLFQKSSGIYYALLAALGWGLYFFLIKIPVDNMGTIFTSFVVEFTLFLMAFGYILYSNDSIGKIEYKKVAPLAIIGLLSSFGIMAYYQGIKVYSLSIMTAISAATPLVVCLYGAMIYKEKLEFKQYAGILAIILGIILIKVT